MQDLCAIFPAFFLTLLSLVHKEDRSSPDPIDNSKKPQVLHSRPSRDTLECYPVLVCHIVQSEIIASLVLAVDNDLIDIIPVIHACA